MTTLPAGSGVVRSGSGVVAALAFIACGGQADRDGQDPADDRITAQSGHGGAGGTATLPAGGLGAELPGALRPCDPGQRVEARGRVYDPIELATHATNGRVRVTVTSAGTQHSVTAETRASPLWRTYELRGLTQAWMLDVMIPGLTDDLIETGDELDFELHPSTGYVPLTQSYDQLFGLFTLEGKLLLFGAHQAGQVPVPDLSFVGLAVSDTGASCASGQGPSGCNFDVHRARFTASGAELELEPGTMGQLGNLLISLAGFQALNAGPSVACDASGRSDMFGVKLPEAAR
jgi:hypothetical protein